MAGYVPYMRVLFRALVIATLSFGVVPAYGGVSGAGPTLTFVTVAPPKVHGAHFRAHKGVRVTFRVGSEAQVVVLRSSGSGSFTVVAPSLPPDPCGTPLLITAVGVHGDNALLRRPPRYCAPASPGAPAMPVPSYRGATNSRASA